MFAVENVRTPLQVKLMYGLSHVMIGVIVVLALILFTKNFKADVFDLSGIVVTGDSKYQAVNNIREEILPDLAGNAVDINLKEVKTAFENLPWVKTATVKRVYPSRISVDLKEYTAIGVWGAHEDLKMINVHGEIFDVGAEWFDAFKKYPKLVGKDEESVTVVNMYQKLKNMFLPMNAAISEIKLSPRGNWSVSLTNGTHLELGRGNEDQILAYTKIAIQTAQKVAEKYSKNLQDIKYFDLRYQGGYAVQMSGVSLIESSGLKNTYKDK